MGRENRAEKKASIQCFIKLDHMGQLGLDPAGTLEGATRNVPHVESLKDRRKDTCPPAPGPRCSRVTAQDVNSTLLGLCTCQCLAHFCRHAEPHRQASTRERKRNRQQNMRGKRAACLSLLKAGGPSNSWGKMQADKLQGWA